MTHDEARAEIACWRGTCLNYFARGEAAVSLVNEVAMAAGRLKKIRHLSGQKFTDVVDACECLQLTARQKSAFKRAVIRWEGVQAKRAIMAHGVGTEVLDRYGNWFVVFDMVTHKDDEAIEMRWTLSQAETIEFQSDLAESFKNLSNQLGQMKKHLQPNPDTAHADSAGNAP